MLGGFVGGLFLGQGGWLFGFGLGLWEGDVGARAGYLVLVYPIQGSLSTFILKRR